MITSLALMSLYGPSVRLETICRDYFGVSYEEAQRMAARHELPVPTFRLRKSQKAPLMVSCEDLGRYIDEKRREAAELWERSRV